MLYVKDHNALLPTSSIGECVVEYQRLPPNQMADKWIPLQGVKRGEIHIQITRKVPEMQKRQSLDSEPSLSKLHQIPIQVRSSSYIMTEKWNTKKKKLFWHILIQLKGCIVDYLKSNAHAFILWVKLSLLWFSFYAVILTHCVNWTLSDKTDDDQVQVLHRGWKSWRTLCNIEWARNSRGYTRRVYSSAGDWANASSQQNKGTWPRDH